MALLAAEKRLARAILLDAGRESIKAAMDVTKEGVERLAHYDRLLEEYTAVKSRAVKALELHDAREREHEIKRLLEVDRLGALSLI